VKNINDLLWKNNDQPTNNIDVSCVQTVDLKHANCWKKDIGSYLKTIKMWMVKIRAWKRWIWMEVRVIRNWLVMKQMKVNEQVRCMRNRLLDQGYKKIRLIRSLKKFIFRYQYLVEIYSVSAEKFISDAFSYSENAIFCWPYKHTSNIKVITKLPNSEQSYKGKVKTHYYINRQNQSTTGKLWKP
jgi:hypothetical protein